MVNSYVIFNKIVPKLFTIFKKLFLASLDPTSYLKKRTYLLSKSDHWK